jgi:phosphonate transport system ATP-binding protein
MAVAGETRFALELLGAGRRYGAHEAVRPLTLRLAVGERVAIVGASGAGKSTLLRLANGSLRPTSGAVRLLGEDPASLGTRALRAVRARVGTIPQQLHLVPQATVMHNVVAGRLGTVSLVRALAALVSRTEAARVRAVLDSVGIGDKIFERVDRLSGGEQQRVAIARTLYQAPELVLADEPLASVDPARSAEIVLLFARAFAGRTLVISTHRLEPLLPHVDRVLGLRDGALVLDAPAATLSLDALAEVYRARHGVAVGAPVADPDGGAGGAEPEGLVTLAASSTPGEYVLPRAVRAFVREHPRVRLALSVKDSTEVAQDLLAGRAELGFVGARPQATGLHLEDLVADEIVLVAAPALAASVRAPLDLSALAHLPRVEREAGSGTRAVVEEHLANLGVSLPVEGVTFEADSLVALKVAVLSGVGFAFTSRLAVLDELEGGHLRVVPVAGVRIPRELFAAWREDRPLSPGARRFLEVARGTALRAAGGVAA